MNVRRPKFVTYHYNNIDTNQGNFKGCIYLSLHFINFFRGASKLFRFDNYSGPWQKHKNTENHSNFAESQYFKCKVQFDDMFRSKR